jgi:hypothetical protein
MGRFALFCDLAGISERRPGARCWEAAFILGVIYIG